MSMPAGSESESKFDTIERVELSCSFKVKTSIRGSSRRTKNDRVKRVKKHTWSYSAMKVSITPFPSSLKALVIMIGSLASSRSSSMVSSAARHLTHPRFAIDVDYVVMTLKNEDADIGAEGTKEGKKQNRNKSKSSSRDKEVNQAARDSNDALLERFKLRSGLKRRLISVGQLDKEGYHIGFGDPQWKVTKGSLVVARGNKHGSLIDMSMLASKGNVPDVPKFGVAERLSQTFKAESMGLRVEASKMLWADSVSTAYLIYRIPYILIGLHIPKEEWRGKDTSLTHLKATAQMKCDIAFGIRRVTRLSEAEILHLWTRFMEPGSLEDVPRSATDSSSLTKPIQKSQVVLVDIPENFIRVKGPKTVGASRIVEDEMKNTLKTEHPLRREAPRLSRYEDPPESPRFRVLIFLEDSWNEEPCSDVHQVSDEREVEVLRSFNWPLSELITEDGVLPERGTDMCGASGATPSQSRFNDSSGRANHTVQIECDRWSTTLEHVASCIVGREAYCSAGFKGRIVGCKPNPTSAPGIRNLTRQLDDALVCCVENTVEDYIMDSSTSFHATYCKEELERFKLRFGKVRLAYYKTLDIAGVEDVVIKTTFSTSWTLKDVSLVVARENKRESLYMVEVHPEGIGTIIDGSGSATLYHQRRGDMSRIGGLGKQRKLSFMMSEKTRKMQRVAYSKGGMASEGYKSHTLEGSGSDEMRYGFWDTKSHQVIQSIDMTFVDSIYRARSATDSSSLTKPIQKSQVVLVDIPDNLVENDSIVAKHGLSLEITQSLGGSSDTSEGSKNSGSFEDSVRSDEEYSEDRASCKEGGSKTPHVRRSTRDSRAPVRYSPSANYLLLTENGLKKSMMAGKCTRLDWLVLSIVASEDLHLEKLDVKTTFLHGDHDEDIYMTQQEGFQSARKEENLMCKLKKSLYRLKQAPRQCWAKLVRILISEWSLSLLKILETKSLAEMFTRLVMKEKLKLCVAKPQVNPDSLGYLLTVGVTTVEWESRLQKSITIDVHQVGDEREVNALCSFNWPLRELITKDGVLPERGYSQFNDVSSVYLVLKVS
ncbi:retrovirus-related pol polyprotein from transposon TNT 1-94 [Tanacetum coccineum]|uniref:Retrovirus-related pol polyprotein from transposon TNT 1-94 n=1 Tax=Tanacetum coccineum TaxID=301880 RepID=A0ABQ5B085_9ASTR